MIEEDSGNERASVAGFEKFRFQNVLRPSGGSRGGAHPKLMKVRPEGPKNISISGSGWPPSPPPPPSLSYIWIHRCLHTNTACWRFFFHFGDVVEKFRFRWRIYLDSCGLVWTEGAGPEKYSSVFKFIRHTADRALGKQESTKLKLSVCDVKMSRVCTTVLNSPSCLVFISGYANTENVFYCLSIIMTFKERWTTFRGQTTATPQCDFLPC